MQRTDGAVYRKVAGEQWAIAIAPDTDLQPRYIYGISTPETAKFAAVMAIASRIISIAKLSPKLNQAIEFVCQKPILMPSATTLLGFIKN